MRESESHKADGTESPGRACARGGSFGPFKPRTCRRRRRRRRGNQRVAQKHVRDSRAQFHPETERDWARLARGGPLGPSSPVEEAEDRERERERETEREREREGPIGRLLPSGGAKCDGRKKEERPILVANQYDHHVQVPAVRGPFGDFGGHITRLQWGGPR